MAADHRHVWARTTGRIALCLVIASVLGVVIGRPWAALALAALAVIAWQCLALRRVLQRVDARQQLQPARGSGAWPQLDRLLHRNQQEARTRNRRLVGLLRAYRAAASALPDAVVVVDRNSQRILWINSAATRLLGLHAPRDLDAPLGERLQPLPIAHWLASGRHAEPMDAASPVAPDLRLSLRLVPYSDELWLLLARDVTQLVHLEQMRQDFVANVSHELRTPLTVIHGYLDMLDASMFDPAEQPDLAPMLAEMQRQSQRMAQLVEDLLMLSRLESQEGVVDENVAMQPMLATLRSEAEALSQQRHVIEVEDRARVDLWGSQKDLHSAFSNLVGNAVRYTPAGGTITIRLDREDDGGAALSVTDTGYGIPAIHLPRITERFYRISTSRSRESGGTGLGLSIVKHVLGRHQARLEIHSQPGCGSRFTCHFPSARVHARDEHPD
jgi:two-component system, OmpR family, phosphate regulon sensor histidine kinase PhoR